MSDLLAKDKTPYKHKYPLHSLRKMSKTTIKYEYTEASIGSCHLLPEIDLVVYGILLVEEEV